ncbi:MAG: hypothetical protein NZM13_03795 [Cyclobacteriaceae bacterium]|nr:hypothetical protein [Cyclobacteriaceae bacterium]MDW8331364.1 hypothetical protein [Cyclobacteriaceae bacterium]
MKIKMLAVCLILLFAPAALFAQASGYAFKVVANKGVSEVKSGGAWQPVKTGSTLKSTDEIKVGDNSYVGLFHASGKPVELNKPGTYAVAQLEKQVSGGPSVLNKYADFILSSNADERKNKLTATGAVHRGTKDDINVLLPSTPGMNTAVYNSLVVVRWESQKTKGPFVVNITNIFGDQVARMETTSNSIVLDLNDKQFSDLGSLFVEVSDKTNPKIASQQYTIKRMTPAEQEQIRKAWNEIAADVAEVSAMNKFLIAGFYENKNLIIDAIAAYEEAIRLAPDVDFFKEAYNNFLIRSGLKTVQQ